MKDVMMKDVMMKDVMMKDEGCDDDEGGVAMTDVMMITI